MRSELRRKFRAADKAAPIEMSVTRDIAPIIDEVYPLYLQVYEKSPLHFEKLTKTFLCELGRRMPDKVRFFVWRQSGKPIAFSVSMVHGDTICNEYLGLDYTVALKLHLYYYAFRDIASWAIANGYKRWVSTGLSYEPKLQLRFRLVPLDLYVRHTSPRAQRAVRLAAAVDRADAARQDTAQISENYSEMWPARAPKRGAGPGRSASRFQHRPQRNVGPGAHPLAESQIGIMHLARRRAAARHVGQNVG